MNQYFDNNENLESNIRESKITILDTTYYIYTDNGVFNKKGLDFGTRLLIENLDLNNKNSFLDMGCGSGVIGFYILLNMNNSIVDMVDVNNRAIKLTKMGLKKNHIDGNVFNSDAYSNVDNKYDMIITNPPIHCGKEKIYEIIRGASNHLNDNGELWIVIRKNHGAKSLIKDNSGIYNIELITRENGFWILKMTKK